MPLRRAAFLIVASIALFLLVMQALPQRRVALSIPKYAVPTIPTLSQTTPQFKDATLDWNVVAAHQQTDEQLSALTETLGAGVCAIDANKDGWDDLFFVGGSGHTRHYGRKSWWHVDAGNRLLLNINGHHFTDITEQSGLGNLQWGMGCAVGDLDNNGWPDLIVTGVDSNTIYSNTGNANFVDVTADSGIAAEIWSTGASLADYNNDSLIDVYISNYVAYKKGAPTYERNKGFVSNEVSFDATLYDPLPNKEDDFDNDGINEMLITQNGGAAPIFAARASGGAEKFSDKAWVSGIADRRNLNVVNWGAASGDFNNDGNVDLYIANGDLKPDLDSPFVAQAQHNQILLGLGNGKFVRARASHDASNPLSSRSAITADLNNDGTLEIIVTNNNDPLQIFENISETNHHWIGLRSVRQ
ncbi:MAG: VCBS repeat-containing protein [Haliea sp.]|nr:VCBS repeat-containing protein [Haliea sp.]